MAKTKTKFRASTVGMKEGTLYYHVIHNRVVRQIHTSVVDKSNNLIINSQKLRNTLPPIKIPQFHD